MPLKNRGASHEIQDCKISPTQTLTLRTRKEWIPFRRSQSLARQTRKEPISATRFKPKTIHSKLKHWLPKREKTETRSRQKESLTPILSHSMREEWISVTRFKIERIHRVKHWLPERERSRSCSKDTRLKRFKHCLTEQRIKLGHDRKSHWLKRWVAERTHTGFIAWKDSLSQISTWLKGG